MSMKREGRLAEADIAKHSEGLLSTASLVSGASLAYYHAKAAGQDAEGYRCAIENHLGFALAVRTEWTIEQWVAFVTERKAACTKSNGHAVIYN